MKGNLKWNILCEFYTQRIKGTLAFVKYVHVKDNLTLTPCICSQKVESM